MKTRTILTAVLTACICVLIPACSDVARDNPDDPKAGKFSIRLTPNLVSGSTISGHEDIVITFDISMKTDTVVLSGNMGEEMEADNITWSTTVFENDTLTLTPNPETGTRNLWPEGEGTLTVNGKCECEGSTAMDEVSLAYTVENAVFVTSADDVTNTGDPENPGTRRAPLSVVQDGIELADTCYDIGAVRVAAGTYQTDWNGNINRNVMANRISLYGGYASDFSTRDVGEYITTIEDVSSSGGTAAEPNRTIHCPAAVTDTVNTVIDGFTIKLGGGSYNTGIFCQGLATINNNQIQGLTAGTTGVEAAYGMVIDSASPIITNNTIGCGWADTDTSNTYGIYASTSNAGIDHNIIKSGYGIDSSYGIFMESNSDLEIIYNTFHAEANGCRCIHIEDSASAPIINYNEFMTSSSGALTSLVGILENDSIAPSSISNNDFNFDNLEANVFYYFDDGNEVVDDLNATHVSIDGDDAPLDTWGNYSSY